MYYMGYTYICTQPTVPPLLYNYVSGLYSPFLQLLHNLQKRVVWMVY